MEIKVTGKAFVLEFKYSSMENQTRNVKPFLKKLPSARSLFVEDFGEEVIKEGINKLANPSVDKSNSTKAGGFVIA
jgi:hypothetical protein